MPAVNKRIRSRRSYFYFISCTSVKNSTYHKRQITNNLKTCSASDSCDGSIVSSVFNNWIIFGFGDATSTFHFLTFIILFYHKYKLLGLQHIKCVLPKDKIIELSVQG